jgi:hypothetical protein
MNNGHSLFMSLFRLALSDVPTRILASLDPRDLASLMQTCEELRYHVHNEAFNIDRSLKPYFGDLTDRFRALQKLTGMLITGSFALRFLEWNPKPYLHSSGLDLVVGREMCPQVIKFLTTDTGFEYEPVLTTYPNTVKDALVLIASSVPDARGDCFRMKFSNGSDQSIHLTVTFGHPLETLFLSSPSSVYPHHACSP